ncbi:MAG: cytochrome B6 [gamma proteobacterium endosymbiont of Lamellibrachia anaximandri]|nr:cytochrome B6 [gamma proteobacterium endosymbiont of Lamellibrachia anaximandri]MBL3617929.1 cytochrome B6 [gamma proteobacterium endosymbiont of Lamellibrachia anaximandri]
MDTHLINSIRIILFLLIVLTASSISAADVELDEPILPLPLVQDLAPKVVAIGDKLFHDPRLSHDNTISCAHCHRLATGGTDMLPKSFGIRGQTGAIKAPTVYNSAFNFVQFWDGRAATLEEQVSGPINHPLEMDSSWLEVVNKLKADPEVLEAFHALYSDGVTPKNIKDAIATFERSLVTSNSRFDQWLRGDESAINDAELEGYLKFKDYGCASCHQGMNVGGNMYGYMGTMGNYFSVRDTPVTKADLGRQNVTGRSEDRFLFKVPSLRLAVINGPYFHDGSTETLEEAIRIMARHQLGRDIPTKDVKSIISFLRTLVGEHPRLNP